MTKESAMKNLKLQMKVLNNMKKLHADLENFHRRKVITKETLNSKIVNQLDTYREPESIVVPSGLQPNNSFHVPKPLQCSLHITSPTHDLYVGHYGAGPQNGLHVWNKSLVDGHIKRHKKALNCRISHMVFISNAYVYFAACTDLSLRVFSNKLREQCTLQLTYSILSMLYDEDRCSIIVGAVGCLQQWKLTNGVHQTPHMQREIELTDDFSGITPWISFIHYNKDQNVYIALSGTALFFIDAIRFEQTAFVENRHAYPLTVCYAYVPSKYLVTGAKNGDIKVWNMSMYSLPYVGCFNGHLKKIVCIVAHPNEPLLITASDDSTIRFWRIETFQETYRFDVLDTIHDLRLVGPRKLYYTSQKYICLLDFNYFHSIFTLVGAKCLSLSRYAPGPDQPARIMIVGDDGGVRIISPTHGNILTMLFPVVTHRPVSYTHDPMEHRIYVRLHDGDVMVVSSKSNPCRTVKIWKARCDDEQVVSMCVLFLDVGADKKSILLGAHLDGCISLLKARGLEMKKVSPARGIITQFQSNTVQHSYADFLTYNTENTITLWKVRTIGPGLIDLNMIDDIQIEGVPTHISFRGDFFALSHENRLVTYHVDFKKRGFCAGHVTLFKHTKDEQHTKSITQLTSCSNLAIFATSSLDGHIKIWDTQCHLLRELVFDSTLSGVCFANGHGDLLVGFQSNLHYVPVLEYLPYGYLQTLLETEVPDDRTEFCISFDPLLKFWYDPDRVETVGMNETNQRCEEGDSLVQRFTGLCPAAADLVSVRQSRQTNIRESHYKFDALHDIAELTHRQPKKTIIDKETLKSSRRNSLIPTSSLVWVGSEPSSRRESEDHSEQIPTIQSTENMPLSTALANEIMTILSVDSLPPKDADENADTAFLLEEEDGKKFWPCAPDGFIPNSIIRKLIAPKKPEWDNAEPWRPKSLDLLSSLKHEELECPTPEEESDDEVRVWLSADEEEDEEETSNSMDSLSYFLNQERRRSSQGSSKSKRVKKSSPSSTPTTPKKSFKKTAKTVAIVAKPLNRKRKSVSRGKKKRGRTGEKGSISETEESGRSEGTEEFDEEEEENDLPDLPEFELNAIPETPSPSPSIGPIPKKISLNTFFKKFRKKKWFPKDVDYSNYNKIARRCLDELDAIKPFELREIVDFLAELHIIEPLSENCLDTVIKKLLSILDNKSGQVRHYAVQALLKLGENRKDVIIRLVQGLDDPVVTVREEVKMVLSAMCGIKCADTLVTILEEIGEYQEYPMSNDADVVETFHSTIISRQHLVLRRATLENNRREQRQSIFNWLHKHQSAEEVARKVRKLSDEYQEKQRKKERRKEKIKKKVIKNWTATMPNTKAKAATKGWKKPANEKERIDNIVQKTKYKGEKKRRGKKKTNEVEEEDDSIDEPESPNTSPASYVLVDSITSQVPLINVASDSLDTSSTSEEDDDSSLYYKTSSTQTSTNTSSDVTTTDDDSVSGDNSSDESDDRPETCDFIVKSASPRSYTDTKITTKKGVITSSNTNVDNLLLPTGQPPSQKKKPKLDKTKQKVGKSKQEDVGMTNPSDIFEIKMVNRMLLNEQGEGREDAIKHFAPRIYDKFIEAQPELAQKFEMTESQILQHQQRANEKKSVPALKVLHMKLAELNRHPSAIYSPPTTDNQTLVTDQKKRRVKNRSKNPNAPAKKSDVLNVQKAVLATAITALNNKRRNTNDGLQSHGILGNQALNDISALLVMFQKSKNTFNRKSLSAVYNIIEELQGEFGLVQPAARPLNKSHHHSQSSNKNEKTEDVTQITHVRLIPSPVQRDMVPGVHGERILSSFHVLPSIPKAPKDDCWRMKAIPERHGHSTVTDKRGHAQYGSMAFHWTTWTSSYDMSLNSQSVAHNNTSIKNKNKKRTNQSPPDKSNHHLPVILEKPHQRVAEKWARCAQLTPPKLSVLVELERRRNIHSTDFNRCNPAPPNTALATSK